jgi:ribosomal protein S18 acetylase RimI-like enzyme
VPEATIRAASVQDAAALAAFAERTFRDTFECDNSASDMDRYVSEHYGVMQQSAELSDPRCVVLLAESAGSVVGYAQMLAGPQPLEVVVNPAVEIQRFYVAREHHGKGLAQQLMSATLDRARLEESRAVWLAVWERNARAISFYTRIGFVDVGSQLFVLGDDRQTDRIMYRPNER